jgi:hypothetical protein
MQHRIAETLVVTPENQIDQPLPLEDMHCTRMNISPPIVGLQVLRDGRQNLLDRHAAGNGCVEVIFHRDSESTNVYVRKMSFEIGQSEQSVCIGPAPRRISR